jgi:hypothetical protein
MTAHPVLYGRQKAAELALFGDGPGLSLLGSVLRSAASSGTQVVRLDHRSEPDGYDADLERLEVHVGTGPTRVRTEGALVEISGAPENLCLLADNLESLVESSTWRVGPGGRKLGPHHHVQPDLDGIYVAKDSAELVVCRIPDSPA